MKKGIVFVLFSLVILYCLNFRLLLNIFFKIVDLLWLVIISLFFVFMEVFKVKFIVVIFDWFLIWV